MTSYNQAIVLLRAFANAHEQVQRFNDEFREQLENFATSGTSWPIMFVEPVGADSLSDFGSYIELNVYCLDRLRKDRKNTSDVVSDTHQILEQDLVTWLEENFEDIGVEFPYPAVPYNNMLLDYVAGWSMRVRVDIERIAECEIPMTTVPSGSTECEDADYSVENSNSTVLASGSIGSGDSDTINIPDVDVTVNGVDEGDLASGEDVAIRLTDSSGVVTPDSVVVVGNSVNIDLPDSTPSGNSALLNKTGQTTSYRTGDDGDTEAGKNTDFLTLSWTSPAGDTFRFTDDVGGQTFTNEIIVDWSTYSEVDDSVLAYYLGDNSTRNWNAFVDWAVALNVGGHSDWRPINAAEMINIMRFESGTAVVLNYFPMNAQTQENTLTSTKWKWTGTTTPNSTTNAQYVETQNARLLLGAKTNGFRCMAVRNYTLAELGL